MAAKSKIEWTECTWNPVTGCSKVSSGCQNCYAYKMANRLKLMGCKKYRNGFDVTLHEYCLNDPLKIRRPSFIFVNSMSDLFHEKIPDEFIQKVFKVMNQASWHTFQILTKRSERLADLAGQLNWTDNIWQGVTVESGEYKSRIDDLRTVSSPVRFISFEPLIGPVKDVNFKGIDWAIIGGESGPGARTMKQEWVLDIKEECTQQNILFYFKQWGGTNKKKTGRMLLGTTWDARPERLIPAGG
jgi:Bacteriophage protein gp37